jgi:Spy/CpxP family protein refolding chaperone
MTKTVLSASIRPAARALLVMMLAACVLAPGARAARGPDRLGAPDYQALGLSADQKTRVQALHKSIGAQMRTLGQTLRQRRKALEAVYGAYDLDTAKARQLNKQINDTQRAILDQHLRLQTDLRGILTQDQFSRLQTMIRRHAPPRDKK